MTIFATNTILCIAVFLLASGSGGMGLSMVQPQKSGSFVIGARGGIPITVTCPVANASESSPQWNINPSANRMSLHEILDLLETIKKFRRCIDSIPSRDVITCEVSNPLFGSFYVRLPSFIADATVREALHDCVSDTTQKLATTDLGNRAPDFSFEIEIVDGFPTTITCPVQQPVGNTKTLENDATWMSSGILDKCMDVFQGDFQLITCEMSVPQGSPVAISLPNTITDEAVREALQQCFREIMSQLTTVDPNNEATGLRIEGMWLTLSGIIAILNSW